MAATHAQPQPDPAALAARFTLHAQSPQAAAVYLTPLADPSAIDRLALLADPSAIERLALLADPSAIERLAQAT